MRNSRTLITSAVLATLPALLLALPPSRADATRHQPGHHSSRACPPSAAALGYSDALDKASYDGVTVGGLSDLAYDRFAHSWVSTVDNHGTDPSRLWYLGPSLARPRVTRAPLVLTRPDGTAYDGTTADNEGLAVLPDGRYLVSSETEPSIRVFGRDGREQSSLPVPAQFAVAPAGQATSNATLEGLTVSPSGTTVVAAMEGALAGDVSATGDATYHRFLVYRAGRNGTFALAKQISYRAGTGMRVPEVAAYGRDGLLVEEASFSTTAGNAVDLYAVPRLSQAPDVSSVGNLSAAPQLVATKVTVADLVACPSLGAPSKETQTNPLLDNVEGMAITYAAPRSQIYGVSLISDDNFSDTQTTRILDLAARLP